MIPQKAVRKSQFAWRTTASCLAAAGLCLSAINSQAGQASFTFDEDPTGYLNIYGNAYWTPDGGNTGGYLDLFDAKGSQRSTIIFDDFDNGTIVQGFTFSCDLKVGDGTDSPADGFSINYAHGDDPVITSAAGITDFTKNPSGFSDLGNSGDLDLPEEGTKTGLAVGFDSWDSGYGDKIGISVRVENVLKTQVALTTKNGALDDWTSLQTGPKTSDNNGSKLGWAPLKVQLLPGGNLNVWWKNHQVLTNYATGYQPGTGRLIFAGRTGGSHERCYIDNINITTVPASGPAVLNAEGSPQGVTLTMPDVGAITLNDSSVKVWVDGTPATVSIVRAGTTSYVAGKLPTFMKFGSTHTVVSSWTDSNNNSNGSTNTFTVSGYPFYGFIDHNSPANFYVETEDFNFDGGKFIDNPVHDGVAGDNSYIDRIGVSNIDEFNPTEGGAGHAYRAWDSATGIGETVGTEVTGDILRDSFSGFKDYNVGWINDGEWENYTRTFPAGKYRVFARLATGNGGPFTEKIEMVSGDATTTSQTTLTLGTLAFAGTGGWQNYKSFPLLDAYGNEVVLPISGKTTFRYTQVSGGCNANFFMFVPVTDAGTLRPYLAKVYPAPDATGILASPVITATVVGRDTTFQSSSLKFYLNGNDMTSKATVTPNALGATIYYQHSGLLDFGSTNTAAIVVTDSQNVLVTNSWQFVVDTDAASYTVLPAGAVVPAGQINKSLTGFNGYINQMETNRPGSDENILPAPLNQLYNLIINTNTGLPYENWVTVDNGIFTETGTINYNRDSTASNPTGGNAGPFGPNKPFYGIPGWQDNSDHFVMETVSYLDLKAGAYTFAVSSDDGFFVTCGADPRDSLLKPLGIANVGRGNVETAFKFIAPVDGIYPFRLIYWNGGGGANVEFYSIVGEERILINDLTNAKSVKSYRGYTGTARPYIMFGTMTPSYDQGQGTAPTAGNFWADQSVTAGFTNLGSTVPQLYINGVAVPTTRGTDAKGYVTYTYTPTTPYPYLTNTASWVYANTTNSYQFVVIGVTELSANQMAVGDPDTAAAGFQVKILKSNFSGLDNSITRMEAQLAGTATNSDGVLIQNIAPAGPLAGGYYNLAYLNLNIINQSTNITQQGNFTTNNGYADQPFPGIPGNMDATATTNYEDFVMEAIAYVQLPAGFIRLGVNSDDGFDVVVGTAYDTNKIVGKYDGGKGASDVYFSIVTPAAGWYPIRLAYEQGGGGGNCEFFSVDSTGKRTLINDTSVGTAYKAYYKFNSTAFTGKFTNVKVDGKNIVLTYTTGVLQSAPTVNGPWTDITTATSPYSTPNEGTKFFRLHQ